MWCRIQRTSWHWSIRGTPRERLVEPVGMTAPEFRACDGGCHCGAVRFEVDIPIRTRVMHCNCSICRRSGFIHLIVPSSRFRLLKGEGSLIEYRFHTRRARHLFCKACGVKSFYVPRSHPDGISVNFNCLELPDDIEVEETLFDGRNWSRSIARLRDGTGD